MENNLPTSIYYSKDLSSPLSLTIKDNKNIIFDLSKDKSDIHLTLEDDSSLLLSIIAKEEFKETSIIVDMNKNSQLTIYFADFSSNNSNISILINENQEGGSATVNLASLASGNDNKKVDVSLNHFVSSYGEVNCYGVSKDQSKLLFLGTSHIYNGAKNSKTSQKSKIMVFDELSRGICKPVLKIDENEVLANHAAAVGKIPDDTMFYLMSRGLTKEMSKQLITLGYLRPILSGFKDEKYSEIINQLIEEKM
ncbi:MAG: SufD family Fe-S cluster assembly protein [Bacilli bacterium]